MSDEDSVLSDDAPSPTRSTREMFARSSPPPARAGEMEESVYARRPFVMPAESDVMAMREEERSLKASTRARLKNLSVRDKSTFSSRAGSTRRLARLEAERVLRGDGDDGLVTLRGTMRGGAVFASATTKGAFDESAKDVGKADAFPTPAGTADSDASGDVVITPAGETKRPESVADFVAKKREIFLVQMSLDAKRAEILKLEREASRREEALAAAEATLVEDARRFDAFLKENDLRVQQAIRAGEHEAKRKNEKAAEIKRLAADIVVAEAALSKREERREDCERYKAFLDSLTPAEFFEAVDEKRRSRRAARRAVRQAKRDAHAALIEDADAKRKAIPQFETALAEAARRGRTAENAAREKLEAAKAARGGARGDSGAGAAGHAPARRLWGGDTHVLRGAHTATGGVLAFGGNQPVFDAERAGGGGGAGGDDGAAARNAHRHGARRRRAARADRDAARFDPRRGGRSRGTARAGRGG